MVDFSHLKKQFEVIEAAMTPEERAERDRRHRETMRSLAKQQERLLAPYLQMERLLAPYRAMEAALAPLRLAEEIRQVACLSAPQTALAATFAHTEALERSFGLSASARDVLEASTARTVFAVLEAARLQEQLLRDALSPRWLIEDALQDVLGKSPFGSMAEDLLRLEAERHYPVSAWFPTDHEWSDDVEYEDIDVDTSERPEELFAPAPPKPSLQECRMVAYRVLREDIRASKDSPGLLDEMIWRMHVLLMAMERDVEDGRY